MPKKDDYGDTSQSEYGNWNVASDYAKLKIMKPLYEADKYETISIFGHYDLFDELMIQIDVDTLKISGFRRLVNTLLMLINNSIFAVKPKKQKKGDSKTKSDREILQHYKDELKKIKKLIPQLYSYQINQVTKTKTLKIDTEKYDKALEFVIEVKAKINEPLNKYDLIFSGNKDEFDPEKAKEQMMKDAMEKG